MKLTYKGRTWEELTDNERAEAMEYARNIAWSITAIPKEIALKWIETYK